MAGMQALTVLLESYHAASGGTGSSTPQVLTSMHLINQSIVVRTQVVTRQTVQVLRVAMLCTAPLLNTTAHLTCEATTWQRPVTEGATNRAEG